MYTPNRNTIILLLSSWLLAGCTGLDGELSIQVTSSQGNFTVKYDSAGTGSVTGRATGDNYYTKSFTFDGDRAYGTVRKHDAAGLLSVGLFYNGRELDGAVAGSCSSIAEIQFDFEVSGTPYLEAAVAGVPIGGPETETVSCPDLHMDDISGLAGGDTTTDSIQLVWDDIDAFAENYYFYYSTDEALLGTEDEESAYADLYEVTTDSGSESFTISGLTSGTTYYFQMTAQDLYRTTPRTATISVTTD